MRGRRGTQWGALVAAGLLVLGSCSGDDDDETAPEPDEEQEDEQPEALRILVTNDDGVGGQGISEVVDALTALDDVEVTVVAPAKDRSGTGGQTTPSLPAGSDATLVGGAEAIAVDGFPADSVQYAFDEVLTDQPHLVVSGINAGQNLGPVAAQLSGTVGAARKAVSLGVPALAVSQGLGEPIDYATGVELTIDWVEEHRDALLAGDVPTDTVANLNVPTCTTGEVRGVVEVPTATADEGRDMIATPADCTSTVTDPKDDIDAFLTGYAPLAEVTP